MRPNSLYISIGVHIALLIAAIVGLPWVKRDFEVPQPISVEMVEIAKITQTTKPAIQSMPKPPEEKKPEDQPPPPPQVAQNTSTEAVAPTPPKPPEEKKPEEKKPEEKKDKPEIDPNALPDKKQKAEEKKEEKKPEKKEPPKDKSKDFSSVLKNLAAEKKPATPPTPVPDLKASDAPPDAAQNAPLGPKMTMSEEDALRHQLEGCWNVPIGAKDAENLNVEIFMVINPDRSLREARIVDTRRYNSDTFFRAAADSAMRAVRNPLCSPFQLPPDKYDTWKNTTVNFNPSQMF